MPKTRPPYSPDFRRQKVELVRAGRDPADLAREFEPTAQSICHWVVRQAGKRAAGRRRLMGWRRPSATFSLELQPGSRARPARSRPGLRIHEREPGRLSNRGHGARPRRIGVWLSRVAAASGHGARRG